MVVHHDDEVGEHLGSKLDGQYLTTETWQRINGEWKLRSVHTNAVPTSPPAVALEPAQIDELAGTYRAGSETCTLRRMGDRLCLAVPGCARCSGVMRRAKLLVSPGATKIVVSLTHG